MSHTRTVSVRDFRENLTKFLHEAHEQNVHFIVMRHSVPVAHVAPIERQDASIEALVARVAQARKDADEGRVYTTEEVLAMIDRHAAELYSSGKQRPRKTLTRRRAQNRAKNAVVRRANRSPLVRKKTH